MKTLKQSLYNIVEKNDKGDLLVFNTRSAKQARIPAAYAELASDLLAKGYTRDANESLLAFLEKNEFLISDSFDEVEWILMKQNDRVHGTDYLSATIIPTDDCNFRCVYCYEKHEKKYMDQGTEERVIRFFEKKIPHTKQVKISWFGGEPLLARDTMLRIMRSIDRICRENGVPLIGTINTNGYLLDADTFQEMVACRILQYEICVDGTAESHNKNRPHFSDPDSHGRILQNLKSIKEQVKTRAFTISVRANITPEVMLGLPEHIRQLAELFKGDKRFVVHYQGVRDWGGERVQQDMVLGTNTERNVNLTWYKKAMEQGLAGVEEDSYVPFAGYCDASLRNGYIIGSDANIYKCTLAMFDEKYRDINALGYIDAYGNAVINEMKLARWILRPTATRESCKTCDVFPLCVDGSCPYQRNIKNRYNCNPIRETIVSHLHGLDRQGRLPCYDGDATADTRPEAV